MRYPGANDGAIHVIGGAESTNAETVSGKPGQSLTSKSLNDCGFKADQKQTAIRRADRKASTMTICMREGIRQQFQLTRASVVSRQIIQNWLPAVPGGRDTMTTGTFQLIGSFSPQESAETNRPPLVNVGGEAQDRVGGEQNAKIAQTAQDKLSAALANTGNGGGFAAAELRGEIRQLASYFCLPIGDKTPAIATAYTAAMILWPMIAPLANSKGENDHRVAENVIIACNSASVRMEDAINLVELFCQNVALEDGVTKINRNEFNYDILLNILNLHREIKNETNYIQKRVYEIVTETAKVAVQFVVEKLENKSHAFLRIDSTNGTVESGAYIQRFKDALTNEYGLNQKNLVIKDFDQKITSGNTTFNIKHSVLIFTDKNGKQKTVVLENRGNPNWVPAIEANEVQESGARLVEESQAASAQATVTVIDWLNSDKSGLDDKASACQKLNDNIPDIDALCCTHYPAIKEQLSAIYNDGAEFINQASIVAKIAGDIDPSLVDPQSGPLRLAVTVGSQQYGGIPGNLKPSIPDGNATAQMLSRVIQSTQKEKNEAPGSNEPDLQLGSVNLFQQGDKGEPKTINPKEINSQDKFGVLQQQFELLHRFVGLPIEEKILAEQGLRKNQDGKLERTTPEENVKPKLENWDGTNAISKNCPTSLAKTFDRIGDQMAKGEKRGIDTIALFNEQGEQLKAAASRIIEIKTKNEIGDKPISDQDRVGILTGFTVIDNVSKERKGGENDGPPGAAIMAKSLMDQGVPVTMIVDRSNEAALVSALLGSGLMELTQYGRDEESTEKRTLKLHVTVSKKYASGLLKFEVPDVDNTETLEAGEHRETREREIQVNQSLKIDETVKNLKNTHVTTVITIERPSVTEEDVSNPNAAHRLYSMLGLSVSPYNLDMSPVLGSGDYKPFTIGIGDGGNELGTGGVQDKVASIRGADLQTFVERGGYIAARKQHATDVMLLGSASNVAGLGLAQAFEAALEAKKMGKWTAPADDADNQPQVLGEKHREAMMESLPALVWTYNRIIDRMYADKLSMDGVNKINALTVDGRANGSLKQSLERFQQNTRFENIPDSERTHNDMFVWFLDGFLDLRNYDTVRQRLLAENEKLDLNAKTGQDSAKSYARQTAEAFIRRAGMDQWLRAAGQYITELAGPTDQ